MTSSTLFERKTSVFVPDDRFRIVQVRTPGQYEQAVSLRRRIYCEERRFESPETEDDRLDPCSLQSMVTCNGVPVGVSRLILGSRVSEIQGTTLPFLKHCIEGHIEKTPFRIRQAGEISRFSCSQELKKELEISNLRGSLQVVAFNLKATLMMSAEARIRFWGTFLVIELEAWLGGRLGGFLKPAGLPEEWPPGSGCFRRSCWALIRKFSEDMREERPSLWEFLTDNGRLIEEIPH